MEPIRTQTTRRRRTPWALRARRRLAEATRPSDRGDVPGWVLVTIMTAGLVVALWAIAGPALTDVFESAITRVADFD